MDRDIGVTELIRTLFPEWSVRVFEFASVLGDELFVVGALLMLVIVDVRDSVRRGSDRLVSERTGFLVAAVLGGLALTLVLKAALGLPRPPESLQAIERTGGGFPSGHTMAATIFWGAIALWGERFSARTRAAVAALAIGAVGLSRLALGVHFLVDVVASVAFGIGYLVLVAALTGRDPKTTFAGATVLGGLAVLATGGASRGWLALVGCAGGTAWWWVVTHPSVRTFWHGVRR